MKSNRFAALVIVASFAVALPVRAGLFDDDVARKQVADQQRRLDALNARHEDTAARLGRLEEAMKNQPVLELANQMQVMREELRSLRGQLEVMSNNIEANAKRQRDMYVDLDTRLRRFEQNAPAAGAPGTAAPAPGPGASAPPPAGAATAAVTGPAAADEARVYEAAQQQRRIGNYQAAIVAFQSFVLQFARSPLAPRAQYWIGDSYYNLRDYKNAIASQEIVAGT